MYFIMCDLCFLIYLFIYLFIYIFINHWRCFPETIQLLRAEIQILLFFLRKFHGIFHKSAKIHHGEICHILLSAKISPRKIFVKVVYERGFRL